MKVKDFGSMPFILGIGVVVLTVAVAAVVAVAIPCNDTAPSDPMPINSACWETGFPSCLGTPEASCDGKIHPFQTNLSYEQLHFSFTDATGSETWMNRVQNGYVTCGHLRYCRWVYVDSAERCVIGEPVAENGWYVEYDRPYYFATDCDPWAR